MPLSSRIITTRFVSLPSLIVAVFIFLIINTSLVSAATPVSPTLVSPPSSWTSPIQSGNTTFQWSYSGMQDGSIWFYFYLLKWDVTNKQWVVLASEYTQTNTLIQKYLGDGYYAWQVAAVDITNAGNSSVTWYQWANDWSKLLLTTNPNSTPTPTSTQTPIPTQTSSSSPTPSPTPSTGPTYYISPSGNDGNSGTSTSSPWQHFSYAIPKLQPGYTLMLEDGTYTVAGSGRAHIICTSNAQNGLAGNPITIKAQHERQAFILGDGAATALGLLSCSYWNLEGLHVENRDNASVNYANTGLTGNGHVINISSSSHINLRRMLAARPSRYCNCHVILTENSSSYVTIEESEAYWFIRHGITTNNSNFATFRRNYVNKRNYPFLTCHGTTSLHCDDGTYTGPACSTVNQGCGAGISCATNKAFTAGDLCGYRYSNYVSDALIFYPGNNSVSENNVGEGMSEGGNTSVGSGNHFYGNISLNDLIGFSAGPASYYAGFTADNDYWENNLSFNTTGGAGGAMRLTSVKGAVAVNNSYIGAQGYGFSAYENSNDPCSPNCGTTAANNLALSNALQGFLLRNDSSFSTKLFDSDNSWGNNPNYDLMSAQQVNLTQTQPTNFYSKSTGQGCMVYVPAISNLHNTGKIISNPNCVNCTTDRGANIRYRYEGNAGGQITLSNQPLWNPVTGQFPCGATVAGLNDDASFPNSSCVNVHKRLNVGVNGCPIP